MLLGVSLVAATLCFIVVGDFAGEMKQGRAGGGRGGGGGGEQKGSRRRQMNIRVFIFHLLRHSTYGSMQSEDKDAGLLAGKQRRWQLLKLFHPLWLSFRAPL